MANLDSTFNALADSTRRAVIGALLREPRRAGELAQEVGMSAPALSRHLRVLRRASLITEQSIESDARVRVYRLNPNALAPLRSWLEEAAALWEEQLEAFKAYAERSHRRPGASK